VAWISAFGTVYSIESDAEQGAVPVRRLTVKIHDPDSQHLTAITCDVKHAKRVPDAADSLTTSPADMSCALA
jgi:hypothetical protein